MSSESLGCADKLIQVLQLFLEKDYNIASNTYLDLLLTHISDLIKQHDTQISDVVQNWITNALNLWSNVKNKPCQSVAIFTIKLISSISTDELIFLHYQYQCNIYTNVCKIFQHDSSELTASGKMAFTQLFLSLLEHKSGRQWMIEQGIWKTVIKYTQQNHTIYVTRDSRNFLCSLLLKENQNRILCQDIINNAVEPIMSVDFSEKADDNRFKEIVADRNKILINAVDLSIVILEKSIFFDLQNEIPEMFLSIDDFRSCIKAFFHACISTQYGKSFQKMSMLLNYAELRNAVKVTNFIDPVTFEKFCLGLYYNSLFTIPHKRILDFIVDCKLALMYWRKLQALKAFNTPKTLKFDNQAVALMILPLFTATKTFYMQDHCFFEDFVNKLVSITSTHLQRLGHNIRSLIMNDPNLPLEQICTKVIDHILDIIDLLERESIIIIFQIMCHVLKNFVPSERPLSKCKKILEGDSASSSQRREPFHKSILEGNPVIEKPVLLTAILKGLIIIVQKFKPMWQECPESICIVSMTEDILNQTGVDPKICTLTLKLCKLAIENFMQPNLALLIDLDPESRKIGPTIFKRLHDVNWEVQDSALEVLNTMVGVSELKYTFYQKFLLENKFLEVAFDMVKATSESYLRASALILLSTAVRIDLLWEESLSKMTLLEVLLPLIQEEKEAIVRREAVKFIKELFAHRDWEVNVINEMVYTMKCVSVFDLDWEVKIYALEFWEQLIKFHLLSQGMINGSFPDFTFSKKKRIIELTETEIISRLLNALDELADQGCLGVLLMALNDESDFEVAKKAALIIENLKETLVKYNINKPDSDIADSTDDIEIDDQPTINSTAFIDHVKNYSDVIEEIVSSTDTHILASMCQNSMETESDNNEKEKRNIDFLSKVKRYEFLRKIFEFDFESYIGQRKSWLETATCSFESTLDDILTVYNKDINVMDCY